MRSNYYVLKEISLNSVTPLELPETELDVLLDEGRKIVLHNDDYNTFDHVIKCLVEICNHSSIQAEQCAFIVHYNGKCEVMHGEDDKLDTCCRLLQVKGLSASIE